MKITGHFCPILIPTTSDDIFVVQPIINCPRLAVRNSSWICHPHISPRSAPVNSLRVAHWELCCPEITAGNNRKFRDCCPDNGYCKAIPIYYHKWLGYVGICWDGNHAEMPGLCHWVTTLWSLLAVVTRGC